MSAADDPAPTTVAVIRLVAGRELRERLRAKSFYILTGLLVVLILAVGTGSRFIDNSGPGTIKVAIAGSGADQIGAAVTATAARVDRKATVHSYPNMKAARAALATDNVGVVLDPASRRAVFADEVDDGVLAILQQAWITVEIERNLVDAGLTAAEAGAALTPRPLVGESASSEDDNMGLAVITGTVAAILLFISLQTFAAGYVLTGVVEEKSTAVVELLLARVRADQLLAGKVIGIGVAALIQFVAAVTASLASLAISGTEVPSAVWSAVPMTLVWFLTGYAFYSMLFALAGSLVSRQEDAQAASAPILTGLIGAYLLVFIFGFVPDSLTSRIMSVIPPIAPLLMPMRMAAGAASWYEVAAALVLLLASIWGIWKLTGRIYSQVLLRRGSRISWRDAFAIAVGRS